MLEENLAFNVQVSEKFSDDPLMLFQTKEGELCLLQRNGEFKLLNNNLDVIKTDKVYALKGLDQFNQPDLKWIPFINEPLLLGFDKVKTK
ncbi:hypothetical protein B879_03806 [Cecembia lonarensis LW9]|uniref:Uncharacterized protein n=1 Tax=Cecembia lonarensis (strain CCUG 58316 / KCTC 22772 / LW9) TaxID=1225176 RepID=K1LB21_CECL9|nr:hypothetical protein B879_03806 [Cecembia lonarensis LW9]